MKKLLCMVLYGTLYYKQCGLYGVFLYIKENIKRRNKMRDIFIGMSMIAVSSIMIVVGLTPAILYIKWLLTC
jgi:hypothetical protein